MSEKAPRIWVDALGKDDLQCALDVLSILLNTFAERAFHGEYDWGDVEAINELVRERFPEAYDAALLHVAHEVHSISNWQHDVANGDTKLGWEDWLQHQVEAARYWK